MPEFLAVLTYNIPAVICLVVGVILLAIEIFLPGFGIPGISGLIFLIVGIVLGAQTLLQALVILLVVMVILGILIAIALRSTYKGRLSRSPLVLSDELNRDAGFSSTKDLDYFIGREGIAMTPLRPAGIADFDGVKLDVVSESSMYIEKDTPVMVTEVEGRRIVVRAI